MIYHLISIVILDGYHDISYRGISWEYKRKHISLDHFGIGRILMCFEHSKLDLDAMSFNQEDSVRIMAVMHVHFPCRQLQALHETSSFLMIFPIVPRNHGWGWLIIIFPRLPVFSMAINAM